MVFLFLICPLIGKIVLITTPLPNKPGYCGGGRNTSRTAQLNHDHTKPGVPNHARHLYNPVDRGSGNEW